MEGEAITMTTAVTAVTTIMGNVITAIEGNATLFAMFVVPLVGAGIGLVKRLI